MTGAAPQRPTLLTPGEEARLGLKVVFTALGVVAVVVGALFAAAWLILMCVLAGARDGTPLSAPKARRVVAEQGDALARALALSRRSPLPHSDGAACRSVVSDLGALDMRFEDRGEGPRVIIVWSRGGIPETYETQLTWVPEAEAESAPALSGSVRASNTLIAGGSTSSGDDVRSSVGCRPTGCKS